MTSVQPARARSADEAHQALGIVGLDPVDAERDQAIDLAMLSAVGDPLPVVEPIGNRCAYDRDAESMQPLHGLGPTSVCSAPTTRVPARALRDQSEQSAEEVARVNRAAIVA